MNSTLGREEKEEWKFTLQGFPTEVSEKIELPDIGELLMYPAFQGILAEDFMKYATEFQKYLFNKIPLRNDKKAVTIRSGVWLLEPNKRSHVKPGKGAGWHIDGISKFDYKEPDERFFIISSPCKALTEFNVNPIDIYDSPPEEPCGEFISRLNNNLDDYGVVGKAIEPCRIYTVENHLHRAVEPERIEFRFFFRVRETNGTDIFTKAPLTQVDLADIETKEKNVQMHYGKYSVSIRYPETLK